RRAEAWGGGGQPLGRGREVGKRIGSAGIRRGGAFDPGGLAGERHGCVRHRRAGRVDGKTRDTAERRLGPQGEGENKKDKRSQSHRETPLYPYAYALNAGRAARVSGPLHGKLNTVDKQNRDLIAG